MSRCRQCGGRMICQGSAAVAVVFWALFVLVVAGLFLLASK